MLAPLKKEEKSRRLKEVTYTEGYIKSLLAVKILASKHSPQVLQTPPPPPRTSPLYLLHYSIKSAITILDAGLQMSQITIRLERGNLLTIPFKLPIPHTHPFCHQLRDVRVEMRRQGVEELRAGVLAIDFSLSLLLLISYPLRARYFK
jgi:hypothetical protein